MIFFIFNLSPLIFCENYISPELFFFFLKNDGTGNSSW